MTQRVARSRSGVQHIVDRRDGDGTVLAKCGNTIPHPKFSDLTGIPCTACDRIVKGKA